MKNLSPREGLIDADKADTLSLLAFEAGLFGWMILMSYVLFGPPRHPDDPVYSIMMPIGMAIGFATSYPANWRLVRRRVKEAMYPPAAPSREDRPQIRRQIGRVERRSHQDLLATVRIDHKDRVGVAKSAGDGIVAGRRCRSAS